MDDANQSYKGHIYDERARKFWSLYVKEAEQHDKTITETWKADMDSTLIFAGLFSAAVTAFLVESYKLLRPDSNDDTRELLKQILAVQIVEASLNTSFIPLPSTVVTPTFNPSASAIAVNVLWFLSLSCGLATALSITLVQQWIRDYLQKIEKINQPQRRATMRGLMFHGTGQWKLDSIVEYIPTLLHLSLFFFFSGLCTFLWTINKITAGFLVFMIICCMIFYIFATLAPLIDRCAPYETPFSTLLWNMQRRAIRMVFRIDGGYKSLSEVRDGLASPPVDEHVHQKIQAVSWVYDRTIDDIELQEFTASIPGLLNTQDGRVAWRVFSRSRRSFEELETRIVHLLKSSAVSRYLESNIRHLRATLCIDVLLTLASTPEFFINSTRIVELDSVITAPWENHELITKFVCAEAIFRHRALLTELLSMSNHPSYRSFRHLSTTADNALRDVDDLRKILDDLLEDRGSLLQNHKADVVTLLKAYFDCVESKTRVLKHWVAEMRQILPKQYPLFSWYASLTPITLKLSLYHQHVPKRLQSKPIEEFFITGMPFEILGHLRLHEAYPLLHNVPCVPPHDFELENDLVGDVAYWRNFLSGITSISRLIGGQGDTRAEAAEYIQFHHSKEHFLDSNIREMQSLLSLIESLDGTCDHQTTWYSMPNQKPLVYPSCHLMSLVTRDKGPFSLLATILDAMVEDQGVIGGLLILIMTLKYYKASLSFDVLFESSAVDHYLETICPHITNSNHPPMSKGSQILLVLSIMEILVWKHDAPHSFPFKPSTIDNIIDHLAGLSDELPVLMAEHAFGTINLADHDSVDFRRRAQFVQMHVCSFVRDLYSRNRNA